MKKSLFFLGAAAIMMASCSNDDYLGEGTPKSSQDVVGAIQFSGVNPNITRAGSPDDAAKLKYNFSVYGTKTTGGTAHNVFSQTADKPIADENVYDVWYGTSQGTSSTNKFYWEYVGAAGDKDIPTNPASTWNLAKAQDIKYWDNAATQYDFVAYANTAGATISDVQTNTFKVNGTPAAFAGLYIADSKTVVPAEYNTTVEFTFRAGGAKVRLGIYETIPGYDVKNVVFHYGTDQTSNTAILNGKFMGNTQDAVDAVVTFDADKKAVIEPVDGAKKTYFDFGTFNSSSSALGDKSTTPTWASGNAGYINVLPNTVAGNIDNMILHVDYTLYNKNNGETINVSGAKAVVPASYMTWKPNYAYTYLFKITDNTNGYTGDDDTKPGLYPIIFDAVVEKTETGETQGTVSTVAMPSIITYADKSVSDAGISYTTTATPIYVQVIDNTNGSAYDVTNTTAKLYSVAAGTTESDLVLAANYAKADATGLTTPASDATVNGLTFAAGKYALLSGLTAGTYAFEFTDASSVKHYKIIVVE